ncbi:Mov34/MPN/PAD-1 family protein [Candidatus Nitrosotenuis aquarius]|uniref:Mov34/MPN/PAD-1 family protein n=1 Tax=Candidatus Nitrosotenuis aquarius TaxID=1846278 RepID=UPI000C1F1F75|nr:M67 family metallopeptidase [Candidatus Nitrosotenuis aquarius]
MQKTIILSQSQKQILIDHAKKYAPVESCALLFGKEESNTSTVKEIFLTKNTENSPVNFTISNEELLHGYQEAERKGLDVIGIFHSHPHSEASPSSTDKKFMMINPVVWVIFSNAHDQLNAFVLESEISPVLIKIQA